jgi:hypothetical protein
MSGRLKVPNVDWCKRTIIFKFPDRSLFSKIQPSGISILWPSLATTANLVSTNDHTKKGVKKLRTNDGSTKSDISSEVNVPCNSQMIQLKDLRDLLEPFLELLNLLEMVT